MLPASFQSQIPPAIYGSDSEESTDENCEAEALVPVLVSQSAQTDFPTIPINLSPLAFALQAGYWEDAVTLIQNQAQFGAPANAQDIIKSLFDHIQDIDGAQIEAQSEDELLHNNAANDLQPMLTLDQAEVILTYLDNNTSLIEEAQKQLYTCAETSIGRQKPNLAALYINALSGDSFRIHKPYYKPTLVNLALQNQMPDIAQQCLEQGADIFQVSSRSENLIVLASRLNQPEIIPYLIERGVDINTGDFHGETALQVALSRGKNEILEVLLNHGAQTNVGSLEGMTPLHLALNQNNLRAFQLLLEHGADANFPDGNGTYPIQHAVARNQPQFLAPLLAQGVQTALVDENGRNLVQLAQSRNAVAVMPLLVEAGLLRDIRNDQENAHDSVVNEQFNRLHQQLCTFLPEERRLSFQQVEPHLRFQLVVDRQFTAVQTLNSIKEEGTIPMAHLNDASEQEVLSLIWSIIQTPAVDTSDTPEASLATLDRQTLKTSLYGRLEDAWLQDQQGTVCASGRINRLLDSFSGVYSGLNVATQDMVRREMLDKASLLRREFEQNNQSNTDSDALRCYIREKLTQDYVTSGILSQPLFNRIVNEWIGFI